MQVYVDSTRVILFLALATFTSSVSAVYGSCSFDDLENKQSTDSDFGNPSHRFSALVINLWISSTFVAGIL